MQEGIGQVEVYSAVVFDDTLHTMTLPDGSDHEAWGTSGIESLIERHVDEDASVLKHFFRRVNELFPDEYEMKATIRDDDVYNIRIAVNGVTEVYPNRFVFFES